MTLTIFYGFFHGQGGGKWTLDVKEEFLKALHETRTIAAIKDPKSLDLFLKSDIPIAFLLTGNVSVISRYVQEIKRHNRFVFLHLEKVAGITHDWEGLKFIAKFVKPTGIVTTKSNLVALAKKAGLLTVQRLFLVDTDAIKQGIEQIRINEPDVLEIMPALMPEVIKKIHNQINTPIITGGLIQSEHQINQAISNGAVAVSTSKARYWKKGGKVFEESRA